MNAGALVWRGCAKLFLGSGQRLGINGRLRPRYCHACPVITRLLWLVDRVVELSVARSQLGYECTEAS